MGNVKYYESVKDTETTPFGVTYRQFQIDISEKFLKPLYGQDIFGRLLKTRCLAVEPNIDPIFIVSDCGFQIEVDTLKEHNVLLVRMVREGCDFSKDSREYVQHHPHWLHMNIANDGSIQELTNKIQNLVSVWLEM